MPRTCDTSKSPPAPPVRVRKVIKPMTAEQCAYLAGILDGEGYITLSRKRDHTGCRRPFSFRPLVEVSNTNPRLLQWLEETTGFGVSRPCNRTSTAHKPAKRWACWSQQARQVVEVALEYLVLKRPQAEILLDFCSRVRSAPWLTDEEYAEQAEAHAWLAVLNKKGIG